MPKDPFKNQGDLLGRWLPKAWLGDPELPSTVQAPLPEQVEDLMEEPSSKRQIVDPDKLYRIGESLRRLRRHGRAMLRLCDKIEGTVVCSKEERGLWGTLTMKEHIEGMRLLLEIVLSHPDEIVASCSGSSEQGGV